MAIFNSSNTPTNTSSATTIIAHGTTIKGDIQLKCHLHIDGEIEGTVQSVGNVTVWKSGVIKGEIQAGSISISGRFEGSVDGDNVEVLEGGELFGKVTSKEFVIEPNGVFEGEAKRKVEHEQASVESRSNAGVVDAGLENRDKKLTAV